jgi:type VI secretion system protein ImpA
MIDLEQLLKPIRDDAPTGDDLRLRDGDTTFQKLEEQRKAVDAGLDPDGQGKEAEWRGVVRDATAALVGESKDLEIAARLTEGLVWTEGYAGLREGLRLIQSLIETWWDQLHPGYEDGEIILEVRARPLNWLATALAQPSRGVLPGAKQVPILPVAGSRGLTWFDHEEAERTDEAQATNPSRYEEMVEAGAITGERWLSALSALPVEHFVSLREAIAGCEAQLGELVRVCEERFGPGDAPSWIATTDLLSDVRDYLDRHIRKLMPEAVLGEEGAVAGGEGAVASGGGTIRARQDALNRLREVAEFFRRTEPHSPMSYLIQRAVRWGNMSFEELMRDYVKDQGTLDTVWDTLGIGKPDGGSSGS